ncbi:MAG: hypothetical protein HZB24_02330 [Desulfobacterales bacterium]|nr:hypothetical protein [Desulfobacterales bacterium]
MRHKLIALLSLISLLTIDTLPVQAAGGLSMFGTPVKVEGMAADRLSAVWYKDQLHVVHGGKNSDAIWHARWDGRQWSTNLVSNLPGRGTPALAVFQGKLHMVYKGDNDTLWHATSEGRNWTSRGRIADQKSQYNPSMAVYPFGNPFTGQAGEMLWMWHGGGSKDTKRDVWFSFFDGSSWNDDVKMTGVSENTLGLCMHDRYLYRSSVYASGVNIMEFVGNSGWRPMETVPQGAKSTTPVSLVTDGDRLYTFYRHSRSEAGTEAPIHASVYTDRKWETPFPVQNFVSSDSPVAVAVPGKKAQIYLLFTRNKEIYFTSTLTLQPSLKPQIVPVK